MAAEDECNCWPDECSGEGFPDGDQRACPHCANLDGEWPCPADLLGDAD